MLNKTKSKIVIEMNHLDNADRLFTFLKETMSVASMGGDLYLEYDGAEKKRVCIGHDVKALSLQYTIEGKKK